MLSRTGFPGANAVGTDDIGCIELRRGEMTRLGLLCTALKFPEVSMVATACRLGVRGEDLIDAVDPTDPESDVLDSVRDTPENLDVSFSGSKRIKSGEKLVEVAEVAVECTPVDLAVEALDS